MIGHIQSTLEGIRLTQLINRILAHTHSLGKTTERTHWFEELAHKELLLIPQPTEQLTIMVTAIANKLLLS